MCSDCNLVKYVINISTYWPKPPMITSQEPLPTLLQPLPVLRAITIQTVLWLRQQLIQKSYLHLSSMRENRWHEVVFTLGHILNLVFYLINIEFVKTISFFVLWGVCIVPIDVYFMVIVISVLSYNFCTG